MRSQADKFNIRRPVAGAVQPRKRMTRIEAIDFAAAKNAAANSAKPGTFGSGEWVVRKDGPINAPHYIVVEVR